MHRDVKARPVKAIVCAWVIEICAAALGMVNAYMTSLERADLPWPTALMIAAPFAMIAVAELSRIPLVQLFFYARAWPIRIACLVAVAATAGLTIENFAFGIERLVSLRVQNITEFRKVQRAAEEDVARLTLMQEQALKALTDKRHQLEASRDDRTREIEALNQQTAAVEEGRQRDTAQHTERCKATGARCNSAAYLTTINDQANRQLGPLQAQLLQQRQEANRIRADLEKVIADEAAVKARHEVENRDAQAAVLQAKQAVAQHVDDSQMHRFAAMWATLDCHWLQGKQDCNITPLTVTDEQFNTVRTFFSFFSAIIISIMGSVLAIGYYAEGQGVEVKHGLQTARVKFWRGLRAFVARRRKGMVREVERIVEVPVDREVERIVEVTREVPVDRIVEKEVLKEVPIERIVEKPVEVIKEVPVERVVEKPVEIIKEVPVDRVVIETVEKIVEVPVEHQKVVEVVKEVPVEVQKVVKEIVEKPVIHVKEMIKYVPERWRGAVETQHPPANPTETVLTVDLNEAKRARS